MVACGRYDGMMIPMKPASEQAIKLGRTVRAARGRCGLTQLKLGAKAKLANSLIARIEAGQIKRPGAITIAKLSEALGIPIEALEPHDSNGAPPNLDPTPG